MDEMEEVMHVVANLGMGGREDEQQSSNIVDLAREISILTTRVREKDSDSSNKEESVLSLPTGLKKLAKKRRKRRRNKKQRGKKRRSKHHYDDDLASSSFTDCTDEDVIRDYIENITTNVSDSDMDVMLRSGMFLARQDPSSPHFEYERESGRLSAEVDETDSYSESILLNSSQKKRKKLKRNNIDSIDLLPVTHRQHSLIKCCLEKQYSRNIATPDSNSTKLGANGNDASLDFEKSDLTVDGSIVSSQDSQLSDNSDTSTNSRPGSEADDEGEESCWDGPSIKPVIKWWEQDAKDTDMTDETEELLLSLQTQPLTGNFQSRFMHQANSGSPNILCEAGGYAAYANHKIRRFVQNRDSNELSLFTTSKKEQEQVSHLAALYNLSCSVEEATRSSKIVLTKISHTKEADIEAVKLFLSRVVKLRCRKVSSQWNYKRRKLTTPQIPETNALKSELMDVPISDHNVGNQMLRNMGWKPGEGLGKDNNGTVLPIKPVKRPRFLGLGHSNVT